MSVCYSVTTVWTFKCGKVWKTRCQNATTRIYIYGNILILYDTINTYECFFCYNWHELSSSNKVLDFSIIYCFLVKYATKYQTWMSSYPTPCYADMQRAVPSDSGAGTSSYWVMLSYSAISNFSIFWERVSAELIYFPISVAIFSMMFHRLMWTNFAYNILDIRLYLSVSMNLTSHFSNFAEFRQLQIPNAQTKYYEILPARTKTHHNTTHKIANWYFEFKYHFSTLQKRFRLLLNKGVE